MFTNRLHNQRGLALISLLMLLAIAAPSPADDAAGALSLTTRRAVVFKDGYALLIKTAMGVADENGEVFTLDVPDSAVLGSFWAIAQDHSILAMRAEYTNDWKRVDQAPAAASSTLSALLAGNTNDLVTLGLSDGESITGTVIAQASSKDQAFVLIRPEGASLQSEPVTVARSRILSLRSHPLAGGPSADPTFARAKRLSFDLGPDAAGQQVELTVMYFTPGLRWIPTYRLSGELVDSADMALQAEILNECEDLQNVAVDLVVGVPHFRFRGVISPLSLEASLRNTLAQAAPQLMGQMSNAMFTQRAAEWRGNTPHLAAASPASIDLPAELSAGKEQDLYVYSVPAFSLKVGGRATVPLWQAQAPLSHLYTLDLKTARNARYGGLVRSQSDDPQFPVGSPLRLLTTQVWHQLELTNTSTTP